MCHVASEDEGMEVVVGEHFRPLSCVVLCAGTFGGWYLVLDVVPYGGLTVTESLFPSHATDPQPT